MTRATGNANSRFRQRKLSTRQTLPVVREHDLQVDAESHQNVAKVETGVEKAEETEHHLQAAISASQAAAIGGTVAHIYIPTPETVQSAIQYDELYFLRYDEPATYIRFSSTVEDCCGCPYNLTEEDDLRLAAINERRNASTQCSENQFEELMYLFEETAKAKQPFAAVDNPPVIPWEEMESAMDDAVGQSSLPFAQEAYDHWKSRRLANGNNALTPGLKLKLLESATDADDNDPYVCFRRREVRQIRKTRGRDAQSAEKLKKLRQELESARQILAFVRQRELLKRDQLAADQLIFEHRTNLRQSKRNLPDQYRDGDDDLLINQKPQKKKPLEIATSQRTAASQSRLQSKPDGRGADENLVQLEDLYAQKEMDIDREIKLKIAQHDKWNTGYVDLTMAPLTPPLEESSASGYRTAVAEYLPTPPASVSSEAGEFQATAISPVQKEDMISVRYASPTYDGTNGGGRTSYRRRVGRGGRTIIDRGGLKLQSKDGLDPRLVDRYKYDRDEDDDDVTEKYPIDRFDLSSMRYRAAMVAPTPQQLQARCAQIEGSASNPPAIASNIKVAVGPRVPSSE